MTIYGNKQIIEYFCVTINYYLYKTHIKFIIMNNPSIRVTRVTECLNTTNGFKVSLEIFDPLGQVPSSISHIYASKWCDHIARMYSAKEVKCTDGAHSTTAEFVFDTDKQRKRFTRMIDCLRGMTMQD